MDEVSFALIAEGITDQVIIKKIINTVFDQDKFDVYVNELQPIRDATDSTRQGNYGGWEAVLEYCTFQDKLDEALSVNDYIVIHIDTDVCGAVNFDIPLTESETGQQRDHESILHDVKSFLIDKLGSFFTENQEQIIFAVAIHNIEFWVLPFCGVKQPSSININLSKVKEALKSKHDIDYEKTYGCFLEIAKIMDARPLKKVHKKSIENAIQENFSLNSFINDLAEKESTR